MTSTKIPLTLGDSVSRLDNKVAKPNISLGNRDCVP